MTLTKKRALGAILVSLLPCLLLLGGLLALPHLVGKTTPAQNRPAGVLFLPDRDSYYAEDTFFLAAELPGGFSLREAQLPIAPTEVPYRILTDNLAMQLLAAGLNSLTYSGRTAPVSSLVGESYTLRFVTDGVPHTLTLHGERYLSFDDGEEAYQLAASTPSPRDLLATAFAEATPLPDDFPPRYDGIGTFFGSLNTFDYSSPSGLDRYGEFRFYCGSIPVTRAELAAYWADALTATETLYRSLQTEDVLYLLAILPEVSRYGVSFPGFHPGDHASHAARLSLPELEEVHFAATAEDAGTVSRDIFTRWLRCFSTDNVFYRSFRILLTGQDDSTYSDSVVIPTPSNGIPTEYWYVPGADGTLSDDCFLQYALFGTALPVDCFHVTANAIEYFEAGSNLPTLRLTTDEFFLEGDTPDA